MGLTQAGNEELTCVQASSAVIVFRNVERLLQKKGGEDELCRRLLDDSSLPQQKERQSSKLIPLFSSVCSEDGRVRFRSLL